MDQSMPVFVFGTNKKLNTPILTNTYSLIFKYGFNNILIKSGLRFSKKGSEVIGYVSAKIKVNMFEVPVVFNIVKNRIAFGGGLLWSKIHRVEAVPQRGFDDTRLSPNSVSVLMNVTLFPRDRFNLNFQFENGITNLYKRKFINDPYHKVYNKAIRVTLDYYLFSKSMF